jgi:hypothetical protein
MTPFFQLPEPENEEKPKPRVPQPPWVSPPSGVVPGVVALDLVLAESAKVAVVVSRLAAFPEGFEFEVRTVVSPALEKEDPSTLHDARVHRMHMPGARMGPEVLRFGFEYSDGATATNLPAARRAMREARSDGPPSSPVLNQRGGGGSGLNYRQEYWAWPTPPPGPLAFVCEWPAFDIPESRVEVDAQLIIDAAGRARRLFDDARSGGNWHSSPLVVSQGAQAATAEAASRPTAPDAPSAPPK